MSPMVNSVLSRVLLFSAIATPVVVGLSDRAVAEKSNFRVQNNGSSPIVELYVSSTAQSNWGNNLVADAPLPRGEGKVVSFDSSSNCFYDFRAVYENRRTFEQFQFNVCNNSAIQASDR
jgi:hypothetical protein